MMKVSQIPLNEWKEYYTELLTEQRSEFVNINYEPSVILNRQKEITVEEIKRELSGKKNNKSPGPGGVPVELLKHAPLATIEVLCSIFNKCLFGSPVPKEWKLAYISSIHNKGNKKNCSNYRRLSVIASTARLYGRILRGRIEKQIKEMEEQSEFRPERSCIDNVFCLKQLIEKTHAHGSQLHLIFVDPRKA